MKYMFTSCITDWELLIVNDPQGLLIEEHRRHEAWLRSQLRNRWVSLITPLVESEGLTAHIVDTLLDDLTSVRLVQYRETL